ncbi:MAG: hypothetical protein H0X38_18275 [Planctomycetes bacterium]|nr:hypothetical protein [Planctomycetota bacterium]
MTIYRLIMQDSIEERIVRLHRDKRDLASELLEGAETSARLSEEELLDLIRVRTDRAGAAAPFGATEEAPKLRPSDCLRLAGF